MPDVSLLARARRIIMVVAVVMMMGAAPAASAGPARNPLCESSGAYRRAHPLICDTGANPFEIGGGGGGGGNGGLIGRIIDGIGGLLGGGGGLL